MNIIRHHKAFYGASLSVMLVALVMFFAFGFNTGIDFKGGTKLQISFEEAVPQSEIKAILKDFNLKEDIISSGKNNENIIILTSEVLDNDERIAILKPFVEQYGLDEQAVSSTLVSPSVGKEILQSGLYSVLLSALGMLIYITFRFEFRFGIAAVVALFHDVLIMLSVYLIFRVPVNSAFIAAVLIVVGYSINDTIVVFDRIRDTAKYAKTTNYEKIANESIVATFSRTINTSLTTLLVVGALAVFGAASIKELALPLLAGIGTGTYSSICIASPIWVSLKRAQKAADKA